MLQRSTSKEFINPKSHSRKSCEEFPETTEVIPSDILFTFIIGNTSYDYYNNPRKISLLEQKETWDGGIFVNTQFHLSS